MFYYCFPVLSCGFRWFSMVLGVFLCLVGPVIRIVQFPATKSSSLTRGTKTMKFSTLKSVKIAEIQRPKSSAPEDPSDEYGTNPY